jgi:hypothetical protein
LEATNSCSTIDLDARDSCLPWDFEATNSFS